MTSISNTHLHQLKDYPADLLKFIAWSKPLDSYEAAVNLIIDKKPVLGEPVVVPFKFKHTDGSETIELVFGIGSVDPKHPYINCSVNKDVLNDAVIKEIDPSTGEPVYITLEALLKQYITKNNAKVIIDNEVAKAFSDPAVINKIAQNVTNSSALDKKLDTRLSWRPLSELVDKI